MIDYADPRRVPPEARFRSRLGRFSAEVGFISLGVFLPATVALLVTLVSVPTIGVASIALAIWLVLLAARWRRRLRDERVLAVLAHVENAMRINLPLVPALRMWSPTETRGIGNMLDRVADALDDGASVGEAMRAGAPQIRPRIVDRLITAERSGQLAVSVTRILEDERRARIKEPDDWPFIKVYLLLLAVVLPAIIFIISVFVMPKFAQILKDFKVRPPASMVTLNAFAQSIAPAVAVVAFILTLIACGQAAGQMFRRRPPRASLFVRTMVDRVRWFLPIVGPMDRNRGLGDALRTIADGLEQSRPAPAAVSEALQSHLNVVLSDQIGVWASGVEAGQSLGAAARDAGMPSLVVGMLGTGRADAAGASGAPSATDAARTLRFLSGYYAGRFSRTAILLRQAIMPIAVLLAGAAVCGVTLALFEPLVRMIDTLAPYEVLK